MKSQQTLVFDTEEEANAFLLNNADVYQSAEVLKADDGDYWIALATPY